ncbi:FAD-dependent oxidoreductase [Microbacterium sp.]|uniref:FAD-dependent oxidoreductase n=1 Tax=Microbacterium sp. TaxID=51671 RepID=UPI003A883D1D
MFAPVLTFWNRVLAVIGRVSMYRLAALALTLLSVIALALAAEGILAYSPREMLASIAVLVGATTVTDLIAHRLVGRPWRPESTVTTALILFFVLRPTVEPLALLGLLLAAVAAAASKYLLVWRGRHVFNPAAVGVTVFTLAGLAAPGLGAAAWWVGTPFLAGPVLVLGLLVLVRTEKVRVVALFLVVAVALFFVRAWSQYAASGMSFDAGALFWQLLWSSPFLFLGLFMVSEPLTLPPRRWQQYVVALVIGTLAGWPIPVGSITLGQERALLIGNLAAFCFAARSAVRLTLLDRVHATPTVRELTFRANHRFRFEPGQYLELEVPHSHPDARGTRREFSIVSAPEDLPRVTIALREGSNSSYKRALAAVAPGEALPVTGVWGDFVLPPNPATPVVMVAAGIGVTPFVSQLRQLRHSGRYRDVVLVYVASVAAELAFRDDLAEAGIPVIVVCGTEPEALPARWRWTGGGRLTADALLSDVPDIARRHAFVSGPPRIIAELTPALREARAITTDAFAGY